MMNDLYNTSSNSASASRFSGTQDSTPCAGINEAFMSPPSITDEEAELQLPGYALAFEDYHKQRIEGNSPEEALEKTLKEWRVMWRQAAFVPHRRS